MKLQFGDQPGARERHLRRKHNNPLFGRPLFDQNDVLQARQQDADEQRAFTESFRQLVQDTAELAPNAEAEVVLRLKERLDLCYEHCAGLPGDQGEVKDMLKRLLQLIMRAMWRGVGQDMLAHSKLQMETEARTAHFALLENVLVADLLRPDSPIAETELVPTLLSESTGAVKSAIQLFEPEQQRILCQSARKLLDTLDASALAETEAAQRLHDMEAMLRVSERTPE